MDILIEKKIVGAILATGAHWV
eukprot:SAG11_NODE_22851_length_399_cov_0.676667_1_plen_21_part_10